MRIRSIHPFPAKMAPELALESLRRLPPGSIVLDPMAGSGTVLRQALSSGHVAIGFDTDPLAVLMSRVWTTPVADGDIIDELQAVLREARTIDLRTARLPWQQDPETQAFVHYWFGGAQRRDLTRIAAVLDCRYRSRRISRARTVAIDVLRLALSRIVITKEPAASLARDTSHSRPHKVAATSSYDVLSGFERSVAEIRSRLASAPVHGAAEMFCGDARALPTADASVDAVITSPPYLNAIDYMRGHRMSLVWLGYSLPELRAIRSAAIGSERASDRARSERVDLVARAMCALEMLEPRFAGVVRRYATDLIRMTEQMARVLRPGGLVTCVVGNSSLKGVFVRNATGVTKAAEMAGMTYGGCSERVLPSDRRYLPVTVDGSLSKRLRTESVLTFQRPA